MSIKKSIQKNIRMAMLGALSLMVLVSPYASAESVNSAANTLKITPVRRDIEIKPGESQTVQTTVTNLTKEDIVVRPVENDFVAGDENGSPALILDDTKFAPTHSLKRFMAPVPTVTVPAKKSVNVNVVINVPKNAQAGGYFGAIRFAPASPNSGSPVNLNASAASLILVTVPGKLVEKLNLTNFDVQQNGKTGTNFGSPDNLQVSARFQNMGNVQVAPFGNISVEKGDKVVYSTEFNNRNPRDMTLPDSARRWDIPLKNIDTFGHYKVTATFTYGKNNQTIEATKSFWVIPKLMIIAAVAAVIVLIALIVGIWWFLRSYKRRILRSHGGSSSLGRHRR